MKASELRIGNWVYANKKVREISHSDISEIIHETIVPKYINEYNPILLTEEWLLKLGFEIGYNKTKMLDVYCKDFGFLIERSNGGNFYYKKVYVQHVHQLQNLYFALTGEELTLNDKI